MGNINTTQSRPIGIVNFFEAAVNQASKEGKVKSTLISSLIKGVNSSSEELTAPQLKKVQDDAILLTGIVAASGSKKLKEKQDGIKMALDAAISKAATGVTITPSDEATSISEIINFRIKKTLDDAEKVINNTIPEYERAIKKHENSIRQTISRLSDEFNRTKAQTLIREGHYATFTEGAALTDRLFPDNYQIVEGANGSRERKFPHPERKIWQSLGLLTTEHSKLKQELKYINDSLKNAELSVCFSPNGPESEKTGKQQKALVKAADLCLARYPMEV